MDFFFGSGVLCELATDNSGNFVEVQVKYHMHERKVSNLLEKNLDNFFSSPMELNLKKIYSKFQ